MSFAGTVFQSYGYGISSPSQGSYIQRVSGTVPTLTNYFFLSSTEAAALRCQCPTWMQVPS